MALFEEWQRLRKQLDAQDSAVMQRLVRAYGLTYARIEPDINALEEQMALMQKAGTYSQANVKKSAAYKKLMTDIERELDDYEGYLGTEITSASTAAAESGLAAGRFMIIVAIADALGIAARDVPKDATQKAPPGSLDFLRDYLDRNGPLYERINNLSSFHAEQISAGILEQVAIGKNPRDVAKWITDAYGVGLTDSMRMTRTVQLYSYRQSNNAVQVANSDVLQGVVWSAELDDRTCMSCIALNGKVFPVGTLADDHYNGRCAMLPIVAGGNNPITQTGEQWFNTLSESRQQDMMGPAKWQAWQDGKFTFDQLTAVAHDDVYGDMRSEASLKSILGDG